MNSLLTIGTVFQIQLGTYGGTTQKFRVLRYLDMREQISIYNELSVDPTSVDFVVHLIDHGYIEVIDDDVLVIRLDDDHYMQQVKLGEIEDPVYE